MVWAGLGFIGLSLSAGDLLSVVLVMYLNFFFVWLWWLFVVGASVVSWKCSQNILVQYIVTCSRFRNCTAFFLCTLRSPELEPLVLSPDKWGVSVVSLSPREWGPVLQDRFSWLLTLGTFLTLAEHFWASTLLYCESTGDQIPSERLIVYQKFSRIRSQK